MKRDLREWEGHVPARSNLKKRYIRYISLLAVLTSMCLYAVKQVSAQQAEPAATAVAANGNDVKFNPLKLGEPLPEWVMAHPFFLYDVQKDSLIQVRLADFKGRLVILDFWASWCSSCIAQFPKIMSLQSKFADDVKILLVNSTQDRQKDMKKKLASMSNGPTQTLIGQELLNQLFPHRFLPHYVWISEDGKLLQITSHLMVDEQNVRIMVADEKKKRARKQLIQSNH